MILFSNRSTVPQNVLAKFVTESGNLSRGYPMKKIIAHPRYQSQEHVSHDIALLKLEEPIEYSNSRRPISLPRRRLQLDKPGTVAVVAGWGIKCGCKNDRK